MDVWIILMYIGIILTLFNDTWFLGMLLMIMGMTKIVQEQSER